MMRKENDYIFKPSKEGLIKAKERRMERWDIIENQSCPREDQLERMKVEAEISESMKIVRKRANECIKNLKSRSLI